MRAILINTTAVAIAGYGTLLLEPLETTLPGPIGTLLPEPIGAPSSGSMFAAPSVASFSAAMADDASFNRFGRLPNSPMAVSSTTRCSSTYGASAPHYGPSTDYFTSTSYAYRTRTQLLTPKPSTTSVSATSTYTQYETAPNNLTKTVYTDTSTYTNYLTTTVYVTSTSTITTSVLSTTTIPTPAGFTAVGAVFPEATLHVNDREDQDNWAVEDSYWQDDGDDQWILPLDASAGAGAGLEFFDGGQDRIGAISPTQTSAVSKVECLITLLNIYDSGTSTTKSYASPPTYTRTKYVATSTITSTVTTRISPTETPYTISINSFVEISSWYTETSTTTATTTTTEHPSSTSSVYAACATDNMVNSYKGFSQLSLADDWHSKNLTIISEGLNNATACCASAASHSNAIFYKYDGWCEVFLDDRANSTSSSGAKRDVEVLYVPKEPDWYGGTYGNGPRGSIRFSSFWV